MSQPRHIDQSARMVWLSLRRAARRMSNSELVMHWRPVYTAAEMEDCLNRLTAAGHATKHPGLRDTWEVTSDNTPLPDFVPVRSQRPWSRTGASA